MAINSKVFDTNKKFVDIEGLDRFLTKTKEYIAAADAVVEGKIPTTATIQTQIDNQIEALDLANTYEAKGAAATALSDAKAYSQNAVDLAHTHSNKALLDTYTQTEANLKDAVDKKHEHTNKAVLDGITANKISQWDAAVGAVEGGVHFKGVVGTLPELNDNYVYDDSDAVIGYDDYLIGDIIIVTDSEDIQEPTVEYILAPNVDNTVAWVELGDVSPASGMINDAIEALDLPNTYEAKGAADDALTEAKAYTDSKVDGKFDAAGTAAGLNSAMDTRVAKLEAIDHSVYAKTADLYTKTEIDNAVAAAEANAKADAATKLASYYTKTEVDNLLSTNSAADQAYAKAYTDELFDSIQFADTTAIDDLFA